MRTATTQIGNSSETLSEQVALARARAQALLASFQAIRHRAAQTRRESAELRNACREVRLRCRLTAERSAARRRTGISSELQPLEIAHFVVRTLSTLGLSAFVFEPSQDTAIHL
jgi:hypothetical protein